MKLVELLFERMLSGVYQNSDKTLTVIADLIKEKFRLAVKGDLPGACLFIQTIFTISAVTKIPAQDIANSIKASGSYRGLSLQEIYELFEKNTIKSEGKKYKVNLGVDVFKNTSKVIKEISTGQPVVMIIENAQEIESAIQHFEDPSYTGDGKIPSEEVKRARSLHGLGDQGIYFHALLIIGYDHAEKYLIGRDIKETYGKKGYFKIHAPSLDENINAVKLLAVTVESVKEVK